MTVRPNLDRHQRACRMLGHALTLGADAEAWSGLAIVLEHRLTAFERSCLLASVIGAMEIDDALLIAGMIARKARIGMPLPPFLDAVDDAAWWADNASVEERKAVLTAAFLSLPARDQDAFLSHASRRVAA